MEGAGAGLRGQGGAWFIVCLGQRGIMCLRWGGEVLLFSGSSFLLVGWGVMGGAAGRCWTAQSRRCRLHHVSAPWRSYLMSEGWGGFALFSFFVSAGGVGRDG
jgi:hypothetical protein